MRRLSAFKLGSAKPAEIMVGTHDLMKLVALADAAILDGNQMGEWRPELLAALEALIEKQA